MIFKYEGTNEALERRLGVGASVVNCPNYEAKSLW